jgi:hypothetical protein
MYGDGQWPRPRKYRHCLLLEPMPDALAMIVRSLSGHFPMRQLIFESRKWAVEMLDLDDSIGIHCCRAKKSIETQTN